MSIQRRLAALEVVYRPTTHVAMSDIERRQYLELSASSLRVQLRQFASLLAERRYLQEGNVPPGARHGWVGDWRELVPEEEREQRTQAECDRLVSLATVQDADDALATWLETADREGWPALTGLTFSMDRAGFEEMLTRQRQSIDIARGCDMPASQIWRRDHPAWRPGLDGEDAPALEAELLRESERLYAEWFGDVVAMEDVG